MVVSKGRNDFLPNFKGLFSSLLLISIVVGFTLNPVSSSFAQELRLSPENPNFTQHQLQGALQQKLTAEGNSFGYIPGPLDLSHMKGATVPWRSKVVGFPSQYDLRSQGKLTSVKDQGPCGSCWAFATYGSLESILLPSESLDFSENHLKNTHGFDWGFCDGGNAYMSTAYLARWSGPVYESDDPYNPNSGNSPSGLSPRKHMQGTLIIPDRAGPSDNDNIKQAVMTYGAVDTTMFYDDPYYSATYYAYYYDGASSSNHAVAIVGWDDNFDKTKFSPAAPGNGAFIIKNSWGMSWGEGGYFYISYYDSSVGAENFAFYDTESTSNYVQVYQYDPLGWVMSVGYSNTIGWLANIFTAHGDEALSAVSFYTASVGSSYELYIYTNVTSGPRTGTLAESKTGTISSMGYHTIALDSPVTITSGQKFSVVVKLTTPGYNYPIPVEYPYPGYASGATASAGQSYISSNGTSWSDLTTIYGDTNVCVKAFTVSITETISSPITLSGPKAAVTGEPYTYMTAGSVSSFGHDVQYLFDWGDSTDSGWLGVGVTSASHSWSSANTYTVKTKARCASDTSIESDWSDPIEVTVADISFTQVTVLAPNGGDAIPSGSSFKIQWGAPAVATTFNVRYSVDNGATWKTIASGVSGNTCDWPVPIPLKNKKKCLVKVIGYNGSAKVGSDISGTFTIEAIRLTSPNGSESILGGSWHEIRWVTYSTKRSVVKAKIYYTKDNGLTWKLIKAVSGNPGSYNWLVPPLTNAKNNCKVKVILLDQDGYIIGSDVSDACFIISPP